MLSVRPRFHELRRERTNSVDREKMRTDINEKMLIVKNGNYNLKER